MNIKRSFLVIMILSIALLTACNDSEDVKNLKGDAEMVSTSSAEDDGQGPKEEERYLAVWQKYDHFSPAEYQAHLSDERTAISEVKKNYKADCEYIISHPESKITFDGCKIGDFPENDMIRAYICRQLHLSNTEAWDVIKYWLDEMGVLDKVDMEKEVKDASVVSGDSENTWEQYALAKDTWENGDGGNYFFAREDIGYIHVRGSGVGILSKGIMARYYESVMNTGELICSVDPYGLYEGEPVESGSLEELKDASYELIDGKMTVGEAAEAVKEFYVQADEKMSIDIYRIDICPLADKYVYKFYFRRTCDGIPFTCKDAAVTEEDRRLPYWLSGESWKIYVADKSGVCAFYGPPANSTIEDLSNECDAVIDIKEAMKRIYVTFSEDLVCNFTDIEFCYCLYETGIDQVWTDLLIPAWEFTGYTPTDGKTIKIYVDALTGELNYYIIES